MIIFNRIHKATDEAIGRWYETSGVSTRSSHARKSLYLGRTEKSELEQAVRQMTLVSTSKPENPEPEFAGFKVFYVESDTHLKAYVES